MFEIDSKVDKIGEGVSEISQVSWRHHIIAPHLLKTDLQHIQQAVASTQQSVETAVSSIEEVKDDVAGLRKSVIGMISLAHSSAHKSCSGP